MARPEVTGRKVVAQAPTPMLAMSIKQFCQAHAISEESYFKLKRMGLAPVEMSVGARRLISYEAAAAWRRKREQAAAQLATG